MNKIISNTLSTRFKYILWATMYIMDKMTLEEYNQKVKEFYGENSGHLMEDLMK